MNNENTMNQTDNTEKEKNQSKSIILIVIGVLVLAFIVGLLIYLNSPSQRVAKQMKLGDKYLQELDYEQAIAAFGLALDIDPTNEDAKGKLASAYIGWSKTLAAA